LAGIGPAVFRRPHRDTTGVDPFSWPLRRTPCGGVWIYLPARNQFLDLGCGTGEDPLHCAQLGINVRAIDASCEMVRVARARGVDASVLGIEELHRITGRFDGVISDFGALNCVSDLNAVRHALGSLVRPGGYLAVCVLGRFCLWEAVWYLLRGKPRTAFGRWRSDG
jgi:SAM-dependent methyltransferase